MRSKLWVVAKVLEGVGMVLVLVGVVLSINLGFRDEALESMRYEMQGLIFGGGLFALGWVLERLSGGR